MAPDEDLCIFDYKKYYKYIMATFTNTFDHVAQKLQLGESLKYVVFELYPLPTNIGSYYRYSTEVNTISKCIISKRAHS